MKNFILVILLLFIFNCSNDSNNSSNSQDEWSVERNDVTGAFNLFPLALNPQFTSVANTNLSDGELVGVMLFGSTVKVYPYVHTYTNEIINDDQNGQKYAFSFCPITKSAIAFRRETIFRASGYLYKDNMTPWDEETESIWAQMLVRGINGPSDNITLNTIPVVETTWKTIKDHYPNALVVVNPTISRTSRTASASPPDDPNDNNNNENAPETGEYTYGIITGGVMVDIFKYSDFSDSKKIDLTTTNSERYIVYGNASKRVINAFKVSDFSNFQLLDESEFPFVLEGTNGVKYDVLGRGTNGVILTKPKVAYVAIWRAWDDFYDSFRFQD